MVRFSHCDSCVDGYEEFGEMYIALGEDESQEVPNALQEKAREAIGAELSPEKCAMVSKPLTEFQDSLRFRLGKMVAADVKPMQVVLKTAARQVIAKTLRYKSEQREFLSKYMK